MTRKARGAETQALVAGYLREHGWPWATDAGAGRQGSDVLNTPGLAIEVKARANFDPLVWMRQAAKEPGVPIVVLRPNGAGPTTLDTWPAIIPLGQLVSILRAAGYGDPEKEDE